MICPRKPIEKVNKMIDLVLDEATHFYTYRGNPVPSVTQIMTDVGLIQLNGNKQNIDIAGQFGTAVHKTCELWDKGNLDQSSLDIKLVPYLDCWKNFLFDYKIKILEIELQLYHPTLKFAGTIDRIVQFNGPICMLDIKSGSTVSQSAEIQLAGYKLLYCDVNDISYEKVWRMAVQLVPEGKAKIFTYKQPSDLNVFISAVNVFNRRVRYGYTKLGV